MGFELWLGRDDGSDLFQKDSTFERRPAAFGSGTCANADTPITQSTIGVVEDAIACLTNQERRKAGLAPLTVNATLRGTARAHSQDMVQRLFFAHTNPDGVTPCQRITGAGYPARCYGSNCWTDRCGENIAWSTTATANRLMYDPQNGWMTHPGSDGTLASNGHRKAILNPRFTDIGVGVTVGNPKQGPGGAGATATHNFGAPA